MADDLDKALDAVFGMEPDEPAEDTPVEEEVAEEAPEEEAVEEEAKEEEAPAEEEPAEGSAPADQEPPPLLAGKYKTPEELATAYQHLENKLGEQGKELGDLRTIKDELDELRNLMEDRQGPPVPSQQSWMDDPAVFENPVSARNLAIWTAKNQPHNLDAVLDAWYDESPRHQQAFEREVDISQMKAELDEEYGAAKEVPQRLQEQDAAAAATETFNQVWANVKAQNPDLDDLADDILQVAQSSPVIARVFQGGSAEDQQGTLGLLLDAARSRRAVAQEEGTRRTKESADEAKTQARVVSATSTQGRQGTKAKSHNDVILELFDKEAGFV